MAYVIGYWHLLDPLESNIASKHVIKNILFQKECSVEQSIKIHLDSSQLLLVMQLKNYLWVYSLEQSVTISSVSGIFQTWWDSRVAWNSWFGFKWSNCSHWCWKFFYQPVWFTYVVDIKCVDPSSNNTEDYGHNVPKSHPCLLGNYLEKLNDNKKGVAYQRSKKNISIYKESIVYPLNEFEPNYNKKRFIFS